MIPNYPDNSSLFFPTAIIPASIFKAIDLILSLCPDRDAEEVIFHLQYVDDTGRVVPHEETGLPITIIKADWLAV